MTIEDDWAELTGSLAGAGARMSELTAGLDPVEAADGHRALLRALNNQLGRLEVDRERPELVPFNGWREKFFMDNPDFRYWVADVRHDRRYVPLAGLDTRSEVVVPIKSKEVVIGVLDIQSETLNAFDESDVDLLRALANQLAVAIENARLYEQAGQLAALEERQKLARELHDSVSQALYGIALGARTAHTVVDRTAAIDDDTRGKLTEPLDYVLAQANAGMAEMRALIFELRPESLQTEGLVAALRKQTAALSARHQIPVTTEFGPEPNVPPAQKEMLYRVAQEAMHNIVKHARATAAEVRLVSENGRVVMEVCDDGQGFDMSQEFPGHLGLKSMRERVERGGGLLTIASAPAGGTRVMVKVSTE